MISPWVNNKAFKKIVVKVVMNCHGDRNRRTILIRNDLTKQQLICQGDDEIEVITTF